MKRLILTAIMAISGVLNAQKGTYLVDGSISFNTSTDSGAYDFVSKGNSFGFSPKVGYQFDDNWAAGLLLGVSNSNSESYRKNVPYSNQSNSSNGFNYGGFLRYNSKISEIFNFFVDFNLGFNNGKSSQTYYDYLDNQINSTTKNSGFYTNLIPAISLNIKNNFRLNMSFGGLGFSNSTNENQYGEKSTSNSFGFNFGQSYAFGISKNF